MAHAAHAADGNALAPVRVGVNRFSGRMMLGQDHVEQSVRTIFITRYHERILRRWVGSFVPHLLGENASESLLARFCWAIMTAIELWEPNYQIKYVYLRQRDGREFDDRAQML